MGLFLQLFLFFTADSSHILFDVAFAIEFQQQLIFTHLLFYFRNKEEKSNKIIMKIKNKAEKTKKKRSIFLFVVLLIMRFY